MIIALTTHSAAVSTAWEWNWNIMMMYGGVIYVGKEGLRQEGLHRWRITLGLRRVAEHPASQVIALGRIQVPKSG